MKALPSWLLVALGGLFLAAPRLAAAAEIEYQESYDSALEAAKKNRQLIMVVISAPAKDAQGRELCKMLREEVLPSEPIAKLIHQCFAPILIDLAEVQQGKKQIPPAVKLQPPITVPQVLFYDASGKEVDKIVGYAPPEHFLPMLKKVADKVAAAAPPKERRDTERAIKRGEEAFKREDFKSAYEALRAALEGGPPGDELEEARRMAAEIEKKATAKLEEGQASESEKKLGSAIRAYRDCARKFEGTEAAKKSAQRIEELGKDPEVRKQLRDFRARKLLTQAEAALKQGHYGAAADALDALLKDYPDSGQAAAAKTLREKLDADPAKAQQVREERARSEAERLLKVADSLRLNQKPEKALAEYKKVIERHPNTSFARIAEQRVLELTEELKHR